MKLAILLLGIILLASCKQIHPAFEDSEIAVAQEKSCGFIQNSAGQRVAWKQNLPVQFHLSTSIPKAFQASIKKAVDSWNESMGKKMIELDSTAVENSEWKNDGQNIIYWIDHGDVFSNPLLQAKSLIRWSGNQITDVDILINANDWIFSADGKIGNGVLDLQSLLVHEFGHSLGLTHQATSQSVMYSTLALDFKRVSPYEKPDVEAMKCEYQ